MIVAPASREPAITSMIRPSPSPYMAITLASSSCASSRACGSGSSSTRSVSDWTRSSSSAGWAVSVGWVGTDSTEAGWGVHHLAHLARAVVHVHAARQARVEAAHRTHDVHALEVVRAVLLEDRGVLHGILVRTGGPERVARAGVPRGRRIGLVVGDLALADHHVMREHAPSGLVEADAHGLVGDGELLPALRPPAAPLPERA